MSRKSGTIINILIKTSFFTLILGSFFRVFMSYEVLQIGYDIGELKQKEINLLEQRSLSKMTLERLATREHLSIIANDVDIKLPKTSSLAAK